MLSTTIYDNTLATVLRIGFSDVLNEIAGMIISRRKTAVIEYFRIDCLMAQPISKANLRKFPVFPGLGRRDEFFFFKVALASTYTW